MMREDSQNLPFLWLWYGRLVNFLSLTGLAGTVGTAIYCIAKRAHYERSYAIALLIALTGMLVMLVAWAQQVIAARDLASWREMVEWQIRAAHRKIEAQGREADLHDQYFECLIDTLIAEMQSTVEDDKSYAKIAG